MHRFLGRFLVGAGALLIAATAQAQNADTGRPFKLGGVLGATLPLGDFGDGADLGFHFGGLIEYKPTAVPINLRGEITYHRNGLKEGFFAGLPNSADGNSGILSFIGNVFLPFGDPASTARPYGIAGLGIYRSSQSADVQGSNAEYDITQTKFGLNVGGGFTFNLSGFETFVEARFHSVFTDESNTNFIPLSFGFKF
jgi:opacity protein-like surface antigen